MGVDQIADVSAWLIIPLVLLGSLLHFVYDWAGRSRIAAIFSAANESYWEHIKLAIWPIALAQVVLFALGGYAIPAFIPAATIALYSLPVSIIALAFAYKAFTKRNILWVDITLFAVCVALAQVIFIGVLRGLQPDATLIVIAVGFLVALFVSVVRFTLNPPREPDMFIDPLTGRYGMDRPVD